MSIITQQENYKRTLTGHTKEDNAYIVGDYPYGFRLRTKIRYWIETTKRGQRFCSQTLNPKTNIWNKAKKGNYNLIVVMVELSNGHITIECLDWNDTEQQINDFFNKHNLTDEYSIKQKKILIAWDRGQKHIKWEIGGTEKGEHQTREEQIDIMNKCAKYEYLKGRIGR